MTKASDGAVGATVRYNKFKETAASPTDTEYEAMRTAATGTAYTFDLTGLTDGESITVNGKTYTYDAGKTDSNANSFKNLEDLQKLLGNDYDVDVKGSATLTEQDYKADGSTDGDARSSEVTASVTDKTTAIGDLAGATFTDVGHTAGNADTAKTYTNVKTVLQITEKASVDKASDVLNFSLQVGADTTEENKINVEIESMSAKSLGIDNVSVTGADSTNADEAVNTIADAIAKVSKQRSALGAIQNRLEHTINNLDNVVENTTSAEAAIRDTDIATEMVKYANNSILQQAGTSMLAQANQSNQLALSLLG
ncbi:MAG: hypothetical protein NC314_11285 [Roseburia sp.]|nr:hypothetical protein [Roseburia sp.]